MLLENSPESDHEGEKTQDFGGGEFLCEMELTLGPIAAEP
jgi:hypothetical protein